MTCKMVVVSGNDNIFVLCWLLINYTSHSHLSLLNRLADASPEYSITREYAVILFIIKAK